MTTSTVTPAAMYAADVPANRPSIPSVAELSDGTFWSDTVHVIVTLAACTEDLV